MSAQEPEPGPDDEQAASPSGGGPAGSSPGGGPAGSSPGGGPAGSSPGGGPAASSPGGPGFLWVPGEGAGVGPVQGEVSGVAATGLDWQALLNALAAGGFWGGQDEDQDAVEADERAAREEGRMGPPLSAGRVAALAVEHMDPGPAMAGWLGVASAEAAGLDEYGLTGVAIAGQKLASWAQAAELSAVAQVTSRAAAADRNIGVGSDGRPARLCRDAVGQVGLALTMSDYAATVWADLAITLAWRLSATAAALWAGRIDLYRARLIAEATSVLSEAKARQVEARILPEAGAQTPAQLRVRLRRAVIAADPEAAERRRADAERRAGVHLYADEDGTATLAGTGLPAVLASAAMAKLTAMARAMKAAGQGGGLDLLRAQVMLGLMLGTLPPIPPAEGAPPDQPPPSDGGPADGGAPEDSGPAGDGVDGGPWDDLPAPRDEDAPPDDGLDDTDTSDPGGSYTEDDDLPAACPAPAWPALGTIPPALARPATEPDGRPVSGLLDLTLPWTTLAGLSASPAILSRIGPVTSAQARQVAAAAEHDPAAQWRIIVTNPAGQAITVTRIRRSRPRAGPAPPHPAAPGPGRAGPPGTGLVGRVTLVISQDTVRHQAPARRSRSPGTPGPLSPLADAALRAAVRALDQALARAAADAAADGCAHTDQSPAYRPPPRLREYITARDLTCRNPACRQPAWRADLDHTIPYDQGGRTCRCNIGGGCRRHHQLKQHPRWKLEQTRPGVFTWTTPAGRTYTVGPDSYPL